MSKDEMNDLQEPRAEDPKLEEAVNLVRDIYYAFKKAGFDYPLAKALHAVWQREVDRNEMP